MIESMKQVFWGGYLMKKIISLLLAGFFVLATIPAIAQELDAAVTWTCNSKEGTLLINYYPSLADAKPDVKKNNPLVFYSLVKLEKNRSIIADTKTKKIECKLKNDKIELIFEPGVPNVNLLGRCGAAITGIVTIIQNGKPILTEKEFENINCHEREQWIESITIREGSATPEIKYKSYEE
jgi:hypothetical protein